MAISGVSILVKFWEEDGVWNAVAEDMAVAVFGRSFDEARRNLREAIEEHLHVVAENGLAEEVIAHLHSSEAARRPVSEAEPDEYWSNFQTMVPMLDCQHS